MTERPIDDRGVSEVVSFVLVFGLILGSTVLVSTGGLDGLAAIRDTEQVDNAERAFDVVAENLVDVYRQGAPSRTTEIDLASARLSLGEPIVMNVSNGSTVLARQSITPIVYRADNDATLVYAGGAVFRTRGDAGVAIRQPPFRTTSDGVHLTIVGTRAREASSVSGGTVRLRAEQATSTLAAFDTDGVHDTLWVNVTSPRWEQWEQVLDGPKTNCLSGAHTPDDVVACEIFPGETPDRVAVAVVKIDLTVST